MIWLGAEKSLKKITQSNKKIINSFIQYCEISAGKTTANKIRQSIILIAYSLNKDLSNLTLEDIRIFLGKLNKEDYSAEYKNDIKKVLRRFLKWKYKNWNEKFNELKDTKLNKVNGKLSKQDLLTPDEMKIIINSIDSLKYKTILLLLQETACRPEEILKNLKWKDIDFNKEEIKLHSSKTGETRTIPIKDSTAHLKRYKTECFYPSPKSEEKVFDMSSQALQDFLNRIENKLKFHKHLYAYLWRHSILSRMIKVLSPKVYEKYSGHSLEMGMKTYAHLDIEDLRDELYSKVYNIEELNPKEKEEIKELKKQILEMQKDNAEVKKFIKLIKNHNKKPIAKIISKKLMNNGDFEYTLLTNKKIGNIDDKIRV